MMPSQSCTNPPLCVAHWISWLQHQHPSLVQSMRTCSHHYDHNHLNAWHLEGDIWTHTMLVLQSYAMTGIDDVCVGLTALLHDIGKPKAVYTRHDRQRRIFKGHESISAWQSWHLLNDPIHQLTTTQKITIFALVALHGSLYQDWFHHHDQFNRTKIAQAFYGFGERFWLRLLSQIQHDMQGQITTNPNQKADLLSMSDAVIQQFSQLSTVSQADKPIPFVMFIGLPASGKTSFRHHYQNNGFTILSRDDLLHQVTGQKHYRTAWEMQEKDPTISQQIEQILTLAMDEAITNKQPIALDMTNLSRKTRAIWLARVPSCYRSSALVFITDYDTLYHRNQKRGHKKIPTKVIDDMMLRFEHPLFDEFDQIDYVIDGERHAIYPITD